MITQEQTSNTNLLDNEKGKCQKQVSGEGNYVPNIDKYQEVSVFQTGIGMQQKNR